MIASEAVPFAKSGGLGDAVSALAAALGRLGHDVRIFMPRYYSIPREGLESLPDPLGVWVGGKEHWTRIYQAELPQSTVPVYLMDYEAYFGRAGVYGPTSREEYADNPERFALLSRAAFQLCRKLGWFPDILHSHDWPSSLVNVYASAFERGGEFKDTATVLTIHNLGYQGIYSKEHFSGLGLDWIQFHGAGLEFHDAINLLKSGLTTADCLTTVSPSYAREIQTPGYGFGLDGLLRHRARDLVGILNGVDTDFWNPGTDTLIPATYSAKDLSGKAVCKAKLQETFGLPKDPAIPLFGMVARLTEQKGIGELFGRGYGAVEAVLGSMKVQIAVIGSGDAWCEEELRRLSSLYPNFKARVGYDEAAAHLVEAGSDFYLMPSRYEPCGLNQMYSLIYGTLPVVHRTGGLADTVENYSQETGEGTGFMFDDLTPRALHNTIGWAVWAYYNRPEHIEIMKRKAMSRVFSWEKSAREYAAVYARALRLRQSRIF